MAGNTWLKKLLDPQSYGLAIALAVILHVVVIALFAIEWPKDKRHVAEPTPKNIQAKVIQVENKQVKQRNLADKKKQDQKARADKRRKEAQRKKQLADEKAKQKAAKDKAAKLKAAKDDAAKKAAEKAKQIAKDKKAETEKQKADRLKQLAEQEAFEQAQEDALLKTLAEEEQQRSIEKAMADEQQVQKNAEITNDVAAQIRAKISQAWRYPPSARPDMEVVVRIQLVPTGEVINVSIITGSGNEALDRSVLAAVNRAQPLPVPKDTRLFEKQFRNLVMAFRPEDAVW